MTSRTEARSEVAMVFLYYDNPKMLRRQIECWNSYVGVVAQLPTVLLVDDGSPRSRAVDIVKQSGCALPLKIFRINEDIPWNFSGGRNLGCIHASNWIYISDIDTLLFAEDAKKLFEEQPLDQDQFFIPKRLWLPDLAVATPGIVNLLFHKNRYYEIGGYDEDYAGHYGREETDFINRLKRVSVKVERQDVLIRVMPPTIIGDARTTKLSRDRSHNIALYQKKEAAGFVMPVNPLRFSWEQVL